MASRGLLSPRGFVRGRFPSTGRKMSLSPKIRCRRDTPLGIDDRRAESPLTSLSRSINSAQNTSGASTINTFFPRVSSKSVAYWLLGSAASVFGIVVFGGLTRLTESGYVNCILGTGWWLNSFKLKYYRMEAGYRVPSSHVAGRLGV